MKSFLSLCVLALVGFARGFAPSTKLAVSSNGPSLMTMKAAEKTYIMESKSYILHIFYIVFVSSKNPTWPIIFSPFQFPIIFLVTIFFDNRSSLMESK
jgi:hypothetical protein